MGDIIAKIHQALPPDKTGKRTYGTTLGGSRVKTDSALTTGEGGLTKTKDEKPFDSMNNIVANLLLNLTRYEGWYDMYLIIIDIEVLSTWNIYDDVLICFWWCPHLFLMMSSSVSDDVLICFWWCLNLFLMMS